MRAALILIALALGACTTTQPVDRPCGVLEDSLLGVNANTRDGSRRLAIHYERGRAAGCWKR